MAFLFDSGNFGIAYVMKPIGRYICTLTVHWLPALQTHKTTEQPVVAKR